MVVEALRVLWLEIPVTFPGLPEELKLQVKALRVGCWSLLVRRYKTRLSLPLDGRQWRPHNGHLRYHLIPPLLFSWDCELVSFRIKIRDLCTRVSCCYKFGPVDQLSDRHLPHIGYTCLSGQSLEDCLIVTGLAPQVKEASNVSESSCESTASGVSQASSVSKASCDLAASFVSAASCVSEAMVSPKEKDLDFSSALRRRPCRPVPPTSLVLDFLKHSQENFMFPNFYLERRQRTHNLIKEAITYRFDKIEMVASKMYNVDMIHFRLKRKFVEMLMQISFIWQVWSIKVKENLNFYWMFLLHQIENLRYLRLVEKAKDNNNLRLQIRLEYRMSELIYQMRKKLMHLKGLQKGLYIPMKKRRSYLSIMLTNTATSLVWIMMSAALAVTYLFISYKATGEVKLESVVFVNVLLLLFCFSSHFYQGRIYIKLTVLQIIVGFTASTHLLFICLEFTRQTLIFTENVRRIGQAVVNYSNLYRSMLFHLIEYEKAKRAAKVVMILEYIATTRERMAQALRAMVLYARYIKTVIDSIKNSFKSIKLLETMCKVIVPSLKNYCEATPEEVYKNCRSVVGGFGAFFGWCLVVEKIRQFVCSTFYKPFSFLCNFDEVVKKFLNEALQDIYITKLFQELKEEFMVRVNVEYRFNHTLDYDGRSDKADKSEVFERLSNYIPAYGATDAFFQYVSYLVMARTFLKPILDIWTFKKDLSFENDCVGSKTFKKLDKKEKKENRILPLTDEDKYYFRETTFSLPPGAKRYRLLLSVYWQSAAAFALVVICTFFTAFSSLNMIFMSFDELTSLTPESKTQFNGARKAARNYTYPGIFSKSAMDFYKSMKKLTEDEQDRVKTFKDYEKKFKEIKPKLLGGDISLIHKLYLWGVVVVICNTLGFLKRLAYGKILEHFYHMYKKERAMDLMNRIDEKRIKLAVKRAQQIAMALLAAKIFAAGAPGGAMAGGVIKQLEAEKKKDDKKKRKAKKKREERKKKAREEKKEVKKQKEKKKKKRGKKRKGGKGKKGIKIAGQDEGEGSGPQSEAVFVKAMKPKGGKDRGKGKSKGKSKGKGKGKGKGKSMSKGEGKDKGEGKRGVKDKDKDKGKDKKDDKDKKKGPWNRCFTFMWKLVPKINLFFLEKFVCTKCLKTTNYKDLQYCAQPTCGAALCPSCAHKCQERNEGKCFHCNYLLILDTYLEFPLELSPSRSLCEEDLEPWYIDPEMRFGWMKPLILCTVCGKNYVLNYLLDECVLCRKDGTQDFDPTKYEGPTRKPGDPYAQVQLPGFAFLDSAKSEQDKHPVFYRVRIEAAQCTPTPPQCM
ncbi:hypothetical protein E2C01_051185 [Portunus trituberculatus]|uniref:Dendritic cell-specific transmembrane protein-like domain-containing protein n=1 Tax=Portunus trituberculatus TaxID=210409 RepID=A0A5B7GAA7_PORTR|nr:hypothetical protein [Portunus trituberculatus]